MGRSAGCRYEKTLTWDRICYSTGKKSVTPAIDLLTEAGYPAFLIGYIEKEVKRRSVYV